DFYRSEYQKRKDKICPFSSLADFNPLQLTKSQILGHKDISMLIDVYGHTLEEKISEEFMAVKSLL
ncbi:hypothetical protein, partial [Streptococcus pneumoniae]